MPLLAVIGWVAFGPRGLTSARIAKLSLLFPLAWLAFTLIRGAVIHWYPYPFIDVTSIGYGKAVLNCFWVTLLLLGLSTARRPPVHEHAYRIAGVAWTQLLALTGNGRRWELKRLRIFANTGHSSRRLGAFCRYQRRIGARACH